MTKEEHKTAAETVLWFHSLDEAFKKSKRQFDEQKKSFYLDMEKFFEGTNKKIMTFKYDDYGLNNLKVTKVQKTKVDFDVDKLERCLGSYKKNVILKQYEITDFESLVKYLKSCGVDPKVFKEFIEVRKSIDEKALDSLVDKEVITLDDLKGSYKVSTSDPYFTVKEVNDEVCEGEQ